MKKTLALLLAVLMLLTVTVTFADEAAEIAHELKRLLNLVNARISGNIGI